MRKKAKPHGAECARSVVGNPVAGGRPRRPDQHRPAHLHACAHRRPARTTPVRVGLHIQQRADVRGPHHALRPPRTRHALWAIQPGRTPHVLAGADLDPDAVAPRWTMAARRWTERHGNRLQVAATHTRQGEEVGPDHGPDHVDLRPDGRDVGARIAYGRAVRQYPPAAEAWSAGKSCWPWPVAPGNVAGQVLAPPGGHFRGGGRVALVFGIAGIELEEPLAGEVVGHRLANSAKLLEEPRVLANQAPALLVGHLEDVHVKPARPFGIVEAPQALDFQARYFILELEQSGVLPRLHLLGVLDELSRAPEAAEAIDPGHDVLGGEPGALLGAKLFQAGHDLGRSHACLLASLAGPGVWRAWASLPCPSLGIDC